MQAGAHIPTLWGTLRRGRRGKQGPAATPQERVAQLRDQVAACRCVSCGGSGHPGGGEGGAAPSLLVGVKGVTPHPSSPSPVGLSDTGTHASIQGPRCVSAAQVRPHVHSDVPQPVRGSGSGSSPRWYVGARECEPELQYRLPVATGKIRSHGSIKPRQFRSPRQYRP